MVNLFRLFLIGLFVVLVFFSCTKIEQQTAPKGELEYTSLSDLNSIPLEYGILKNVTTHSMYGGWSQLWFEDEQQTIRMVRVNFHTNRIHKDVLVIGRK